MHNYAGFLRIGSHIFSVSMYKCIICDIILYNTDPNITAGPVDVRLASFTNDSSDIAGRVEVKYAGEWGTICGRSWDLADANIICRQLGYAHALRAITYVAIHSI